jgi:mycofactocin precursor
VDTTTIADEQLTTTDPVEPSATVSDADLVTDELLVEEVSIDGMCGVY